MAQRGGHAFFEIPLIKADGRGRAARGDHRPHQVPVAAGGQNERDEKHRREGDRGTHQVVQQHGGSEQIAAGQSRLPVAGRLPGPDGEVGRVRHDRGGRADRIFVAHGEHGAYRVHGVGGDQRRSPSSARIPRFERKQSRTPRPAPGARCGEPAAHDREPSGLHHPAFTHLNDDKDTNDGCGLRRRHRCSRSGPASRRRTGNRAPRCARLS